MDYSIDNLSKIRVQNFKSIESEEFNVEKSTFISGLNSSGKSSFSQAVLLIMQWLSGNSHATPGNVSLNGDLIEFGNTKDIYHRSSLNEGSKFFLKPIKIELIFEDQVNSSKTNLDIELTPRFYKDKDSELYDIDAKNEIEITKFSQRDTYQKDHEIISAILETPIRDVKKNHNTFDKILTQYEEDKSQDPASIKDLSIEKIYKITPTTYEPKDLTKKMWLGSALARTKQNSNYFSITHLNNNIPQLIIRLKYGKLVYESTEFYPSQVSAGSGATISLSSSVKSNTFTDGLIKNYINSMPDNINLNNYEKINDRSLSVVNGKDLVKCRLSFLVLQNLKHPNKYLDDKYKLSKSLDDFSSKQYLDDDEFDYLLKKINNQLEDSFSTTDVKFQLTKDKESKYVDQLLATLIFLRQQKANKLMKNIEKDQSNENKSIGKKNEKFVDSTDSLIEGSFGVSTNLLENISNKEEQNRFFQEIKSIFQDFNKRLAEDRKGQRDELGQRPLKYVFDLYNFLMVRDRGYKRNLRRKFPHRSLSSQTREFERFFYDIYGDNFQIAKSFVTLSKLFYTEIEKLFRIIDKESTNLWNKVRLINKLYNLPSKINPINQVDELLKDSVVNIFDKLFEVNDVEKFNKQKLICLFNLGIPTVTDNELNSSILNISHKVQNVEHLIELEHKKTKPLKIVQSLDELEEEDIKNSYELIFSDKNSDKLDFTSHYNFNQTQLSEFLFVSLTDSSIYHLNTFPNLGDKFSFLSGSVNRNYLSRGLTSSLTPIGFHGEKLSTVLSSYKKAKESLIAPTPTALSLFTDATYQRKILSNFGGKINQQFLNSLNSEINSSLPRQSLNIDQPILSHLNEWVKYLGFGTFIDLEEFEYSGIANIRIDDDTINNVGSGVGQALPVITQILLSENKILFLEEIEQNLHASAQARLADMVLLFSLIPGRQFIIETHSEHIINRIRLRTLQISNLLDENFNYPYSVLFTSKSGFKTKIQQMELDKSGRFIAQNFPDGFFDQAQLDTIEILKNRFEE